MNRFSDMLTSLAGVAAITAWQNELEYWMRVVAAGVAITAGLIAIYQRLRKKSTE